MSCKSSEINLNGGGITGSLEYIMCPCCGHSNSTTVANPISHFHNITGRFSIVRCHCCGLHYLNPRPDQQTLQECYQLLEQENPVIEYPDKGIGQEGMIRYLWRKFNYSSPCLALVDRGPVLDIGCNTGGLLSQIEKHGYEAHGLESNPKAVEICLNKKLNVILGDIHSYDIPKQFYKCIVMSHILEHLSDPVLVLRTLRHSLDADGRIIICVPNCQSPMVKLFGDSWHGWDPPFHLINFDKTSLRRVCEKAGLKVIRLQVKGHPEDFTRSLNISLGKTRRHLFLRAALWPFFATAQVMGHGSYLLAVASL